MFNLPPSDYKRFLSFLQKHDCHVPFQLFRAVAATQDSPLRRPTPDIEKTKQAV